MRKRILSIILAGTMILSVTACGGKSENIDKSGSSEQSTAEESQNEESEKEEDTGEITFEELTVVDNEYCKIVLTGIEPDNIWGYTIKAMMENKTADKTYMYSVESASVNGVQVEPFFATEISAGKKSNEEITISDDSLEANGIEKFTDIELSFHVYNSEDWGEEAAANETVHIYPYGEENAASFVREPQGTDNVIVDNEFVSIIVIGSETDEYGDFLIKLFIQNKSEYDLMASEDNASLNGYMADPFWASSVKAGKCKFSELSWFASDLEANDITEVTDAEFNIRVYKYDYDYTECYIVDQVISLQF